MMPTASATPKAYLGLVPSEFSSGDSQRRGPITKAGPGRARWLRIQTAVSILRRRPPAAEPLWTWTWALRIAARRGKHVAVVALARRLAGILYALLCDRSVLEPRQTVGLPTDGPAGSASPMAAGRAATPTPSRRRHRA
jgi:Transposase IS116/IS110/IS902 family